MTTYPGLPGPLICDFLSREASRGRYAPGVEFQIGKIEMVANTGTYLDSPFHRYADGKDLSALPLELAGGPRRGRGPRRRGRLARSIAPRFAGRPVGGKRGAGAYRLGRALGHAGDTSTGNPYLTADAAAYLVAEGAALVGIDSLNIDDIGRLARPVHSIAARGRDPDRRAPCHLGQLPDARLPLLGGAAQGRRVRHLAGARLRHARRFRALPFRQTTVAGFPAIALRSERSWRSWRFPSIGMRITHLRRLRGREWLWRSDQIPARRPRPGSLLRRDGRQRRVGRVLSDGGPSPHSRRAGRHAAAAGSRRALERGLDQLRLRARRRAPRSPARRRARSCRTSCTAGCHARA